MCVCMWGGRLAAGGGGGGRGGGGPYILCFSNGLLFSRLLFFMHQLNITCLIHDVSRNADLLVPLVLICSVCNQHRMCLSVKCSMCLIHRSVLIVLSIQCKSAITHMKLKKGNNVKWT